ncbi:MAG: metal ABC transporter substrate-binding protein [Clostridia bacterium]|nr:metal ABC transporter substrate-binding protein [Clostridia bacterium]MDD4376141.1 metal ABC transporter substrate-binding protein [Clostridia bacterium]
MKRIIITFSILFLVIVLLLTIAFNIKKEESKNSEEKVKIVATLFPQYDFAKQIGGDLVDVSLLLPPGTDVHTYDPAPKDIVSINKSNVFLYTGPQMEPWAANISQNLNNSVKIVNVAEGIELFQEETQEHEHEDEHHHEKDPHIWLDINNAKIMAKNICEILCIMDNVNSYVYKKNAEEYIKKLNELDNSFEQTINNGKRNKIAFGDKFAYSYFVNRYKIDYISAYDGCSESAEPSISKIISIEKEIEKEKIPVIFYESLSEGKIAKSIASKTGIKALVFSSVHNVSSGELKNGTTYIDIMEKNRINLEEAIN